MPAARLSERNVEIAFSLSLSELQREPDALKRKKSAFKAQRKNSGGDVHTKSGSESVAS